MKKSGLFFIFVWLIAVFTPFQQANSVSQKQTGTPSAEPTISSSAVNKLRQIEALKEKIATKIAQIRKKEKTAFSGMVKKVDSKGLILTTKNGDKTIVFSDDVIMYSLDNGKKSLRKTSPEASDQVVVFGYLNEDHSVLSAKYVYTYKSVSWISGKIAGLDKENFSISLSNAQGSHTVDVEKYTRIYTIQNGKLTRSGFSKLASDEFAHILSSSASATNRFSASIILALPLPSQLPQAKDEAASASAKPKHPPKSTIEP